MRFASVLAALLGLVLVTADAQTNGLPQTIFFGQYELEWRSTTMKEAVNGVAVVTLKTNRGQILGHYHPPAGAIRGGAVWVHGAGGNPGGPARGLYTDACRRLQRLGIVGLRLEYRHRKDFYQCALDALTGIAFLRSQGVKRVAVVGHSFGSGVAICSAATSPYAHAAVAMSSQIYGSAQLAPHLAPRSLLLIHGGRDQILPLRNAHELFAAAREPKTLKIFPEAGHGLGQACGEILDLLQQWIPRELSRTRQARVP